MQVIVKRLAVMFIFALGLPQDAVTQTQSITLFPDTLVADSVEARDVEVSRFGTWIAAYDTTEGNSVRMFDDAMQQIWRHRLRYYWPGSVDRGSVIQFAPDETFVLFPGVRDSTDICVCDTATGEVVDVLRGHKNDIRAIALSGDGRWLVSASHDEVILWERDDGSFTVRHVMGDFEPSVHALEFLPDSRRFAMGTREDRTRSVVVFEIDSWTPREVFRHSLTDNNVGFDFEQIAVSRNGWLAAGYRESILLFTVTDTEINLAQRIDDIDLGSVHGLAFAPDETLLVSGHFGFLRWWKESNGRWVETATSSTQQPVANDIEMTADGRSLFIASRADENALSRFIVEGVGPSSLGAIASLIGGVVTEARRSVLTDRFAASLTDELGEEALAPRDMFETREEYEQRIAAARRTVLARVYHAIEDRYGAERTSETESRYDVIVPMQDRGSYDIDRTTYSLRFMDAGASLVLERSAARELFENWTDARVRATRYERDGLVDYADFRLMHPNEAREYQLFLERNPFTGERLNEAAVRFPRISLGNDLVIHDFEIDGIFPTLFARYATESFGRFDLENTGSGIISDLDIRFEIAGLTDANVPISAPTSLARGQRLSVEVVAPIAASVLDAGEGSTAQMRVAISYRRGSERREQVISRQIRVLNRNAIQWSDDLRIGAFMSVSQSSVLSWAGQVAGAIELAPTAVLSRNLLYAIQLFEALEQAGIRYVIDPNSAYESLSEDSHAIDYLRFPNETLAFGAGDCDDLSVLYATLLESVGVATAFITTPGHILIAFDTGVAPHDFDRVFDSTERLIVRNGTVWMPVETTELARGFTAAWSSGAAQWSAAAQTGVSGFFTAREAWAAYPPAGARTDAPVPAPDLEATVSAARRELDAFREMELEPKLRRLVGNTEDPTSPAVQNRIGILHASYGLFDVALEHFRSAAERGSVAGLVNEATVLSLRGLHDQAQATLERAREIDPTLALSLPLFDQTVDGAEFSGRAGVDGSTLFVDWMDEQTN